MFRPSLRARRAIRALRQVKNTGDISDSFEIAAALEVDGRSDPTPPKHFVRRFTVQRRLISNTVVFIVRTTKQRPQRAVLHIHGGGFTDDFTAGTWDTIARIAHRTKSEVWAIAYRLAPRQTAETTVSEAAEVYREMLREWPAEAIAGIGDSAGGGLLLAATQVATATGSAPLAMLVLVSPWIDLTMPDADLERAAERDPMLDRERLESAAMAYAGKLPLHDPRVSPVYGRLAGLPSVWITAAGDDALVYQGRRLRDALQNSGIPVHYTEDAGMMHVHAFFPIPEGRAALKPALDAIRSL